jgi:hypothetical protein
MSRLKECVMTTNGEVPLASPGRRRRLPGVIALAAAGEVAVAVNTSTASAATVDIIAWYETGQTPVVVCIS